MSDDPLRYRPRSRLRTAFERWVLRASMAIDVHLTLEAREDLADEAMEAAMQFIFAALRAEQDRQAREAASLTAQLDAERRRRVAHTEQLRQRRAGGVYDREHGFEATA